jgi:hypothetical protein
MLAEGDLVEDFWCFGFDFSAEEPEDLEGAFFFGLGIPA